MTDKRSREHLKQQYDLTDEQFDRWQSTSMIPRNMGRFLKYRIVATVVRAERCSAGMKVGQHFIMGTIPTVLLPESTAPYCLRALAPIFNQTDNILQMIADGVDEEGIVFPTIRCMDPGLEDGGLGTVVFEFGLRKADISIK
jgi:uncharacterized repeat protein (TIGR04076 family)